MSKLRDALVSLLQMIFCIAIGRMRPFVSHSREEDEQAVACLMASLTSGTNVAGTLNDRSPALNKLGMISIRPASSPQRETGVSPDSLITNSMSRRILG